MPNKYIKTSSFLFTKCYSNNLLENKMEEYQGQ